MSGIATVAPSSSGCAALNRLAAGLCFAAVVSNAWAGDAASAAERGALIFNGDIRLPARLRGHAQNLPTAAAKCVNCHSADAGRQGFAPPLTSASLTTPRPRRGGPASAYDVAAFCRVLRTGIDPMHIMLARAMPQFDATDRDCNALWAFLARRGSGS